MASYAAKFFAIGEPIMRSAWDATYCQKARLQNARIACIGRRARWVVRNDMKRTITDDVGGIELVYYDDTHELHGYVDGNISKIITDAEFKIICDALKIMYEVDIT
jgi:hypothetical protein